MGSIFQIWPELWVTNLNQNGTSPSKTWLMLGSHRRFLSMNSDVHLQNEEFRRLPPKEQRVNKVDHLLVNEAEHVLLLVVFCR